MTHNPSLRQHEDAPAIVFARCHCGRYVRVESVKVNRFTDSIVLVAATCAKHGNIWCKDYAVWP